MKTLCLPLKKEWYEMIESGVKTEEYREIKSYWANRLRCQADGFCTPKKACLLARTRNFGICDIRYTHVKFSYGYTKRTMTFEIESITIGKGNPEWGAPTEDVFIIKLGKRVGQQTSKRKSGMSIETKYNIGDEVWFQTLGRIRKAKIIHITIDAFHDGNHIINYNLQRYGYSYDRHEEELFPTKEELLKSL